MDSKIILAILIVALIGIVAATYNNEATDAIETLTSVATEDDSQDSATDILDSNIGSNSENSLKIDEDVVKPDNPTNIVTNNKNNKASTTKTVQTSSNSNGGTSNQKTNNPTANNSINTNVNTNSSNNQDINSTTVKISSARAKEIATNNLPENFKNAIASTPKLYDKYYEVTFFMDGKAIGYYEIDADTGVITGGAFEGEVPDLSN